MAASDKVANGVERACADAVEAAALEDRVGEVFDAMVVDKREKGGAVVQIQDPAVLANADGQNQLGTRSRSSSPRPPSRPAPSASRSSPSGDRALRIPALFRLLEAFFRISGSIGTEPARTVHEAR